MSNREDRDHPYICCVLCGAEIASYAGRQLQKAHGEWGAWAARKINKWRRSLLVPAGELEDLDYLDSESHIPISASFYRAILDNPKTGCLSISGISPHRESYGVQRDYIVTDSDKALVIPGPKMARQRWNKEFRMANLFGTDRNREKGLLIGYTMHPHCWLLVDRFLGHGVVKQDLRAFVQAVKLYWRVHQILWMSFLIHDICEYPCYDNAAPWIKENCPAPKKDCPAPKTLKRHIHASGSPLRIRDIQKLIAMATEVHQKSLGHVVWLRSTVYIPVEIRMMIIDTIYLSRPRCHERIQDTRNVLEAFQWKLPDSYWQRLCNPNLVFEVQGLIDAGTQIDWAYFCLGLHDLLLQDDWYCTSGLYFRGRVLNIIESIRGSISNTI